MPSPRRRGIGIFPSGDKRGFRMGSSHTPKCLTLLSFPCLDTSAGTQHPPRPPDGLNPRTWTTICTPCHLLLFVASVHGQERTRESTARPVPSMAHPRRRATSLAIPHPHKPTESRTGQRAAAESKKPFSPGSPRCGVCPFRDGEPRLKGFGRRCRNALTTRILQPTPCYPANYLQCPTDLSGYCYCTRMFMTLHFVCRSTNPSLRHSTRSTT